MRWLRRLLPLILTLAAAAALIFIPDLSPEGYADLTALFSHERQRQANAGFSVVVVRDGKQVYLQSFGVDGAGQPLAKDSPLYLGPSSELLSGALLSSLAITGQLDLDKEISAYLPNLPANIEKAISARTESNLPTLRQLASYSVPLDRISLAEFRARTIGLEAGELDPEMLLRSRLDKSRVPRSRFVYRILGVAMENAGGASFDELLQSRILIPLGMHGTTARPDSLQGVALGSGLFFGISFPYESRVPFIAAPADGIVSTIEDIGRFLAYLTARPGSPGETAGMPRLSAKSLHEPLLPKGDTGFGWRIGSHTKRRMVYQGGSVEGFCSRVVLWPDENAGIAILSSQGGAIQANIVLPLLTQAAERIIFEGSSPRLLPLNRALAIAGIAALTYLASLFFQTLTVFSWARRLSDRDQAGERGVLTYLILGRTWLGLILRIALLFLVPVLGSFVVGTDLVYHDLLVMEPGGAAFLLAAILVGSLRNLARLLWYRQLRHG